VNFFFVILISVHKRAKLRDMDFTTRFFFYRTPRSSTAGAEHSLWLGREAKCGRQEIDTEFC